MSEHAHEEIYKGYKIVIDYDDSRLNPREEQDNTGTMICFHGRYKLGDEHSYSDPIALITDLTGLDDDDLGQNNPNDDLGDGSKWRIVWEPLYLYDHGGITMKTTPFSCPWDSGQVGMIYVTYDKIMKDLGVKPETTLGSLTDKWVPSKEIIEQYEKILKAEVKTYDQYLRGDVYGYAVYAPNTDRDDDTDDLWQDTGEDECWNYYGMESAIEAAKESIDGLLSE